MYKNKSLLLLLGNNFFSSIGFGFQLFIMSWLAYDITGSAAAIGGTLAISMIPRILLSPFIGVFIDRWDRKKTIIYVQILRGIILLVIPIAILLNALTLIVVYSIAFIWNIIDRFYMPAFKGLIKETISQEDLIKGNTMLNVIFQCGMIIGTILAGFLLEHLGNNISVLFNSVVFIISAFLIGAVERENILLKTEKTRMNFKIFLNDLRNTGKYLSFRVIILMFGSLVAVNELLVQIVNIMLLPYVTEVLMLGTDIVGVFSAFFALGAIVGGIFFIRILEIVGRKNFIWFSIVLLGALFASIPLYENFYYLCLIMFLLGAVALQSRTLFSTTILEKVDNEFQGRVNSLINMSVSLLGFFVYILMGLIGDIFPIRNVFIIVGVVVILTSMISIFINKHESKNINNIVKVK